MGIDWDERRRGGRRDRMEGMGRRGLVSSD